MLEFTPSRVGRDGPSTLFGGPVVPIFPLSCSRPPCFHSPAVSLMRPASVRYLGFEATDTGREYALSVDGEAGSRRFLVLIPHTAFSSRRVRFQDAPDLCFAKIQRELASDPALLPGATLVVSEEELTLYSETQTKRTPERKKRMVTPEGGA